MKYQDKMKRIELSKVSQKDTNTLQSKKIEEMLGWLERQISDEQNQKKSDMWQGDKMQSYISGRIDGFKLVKNYIKGIQL